MSEAKTINQLIMTSDLVSIVCHVWRKYYIYGEANLGQIVAICFVLIDAEVSPYIPCSSLIFCSETVTMITISWNACM